MGNLQYDPESNDPYAVLAPFYRPLISVTGVLDAEVELLLCLFERASVASNARILDMGCGTGDVIGSLSDHGYTQLFGIDISRAMISMAKQRNPQQVIAQQDWISMSEFCEQDSHFDIVYCLSNSISHLGAQDIEVVLLQVLACLNEGGLFLFDSRLWSTVQSHGLQEPDRPPGTYRWLAEVLIEGRTYWIDDFCEYESDRQIVRYRIRRRHMSGRGWDEEQFAQVSYAIISLESWQNFLTAAGFVSVEIQIANRWPYAIIIARKA